jgi:hypothetical protein
MTAREKLVDRIRKLMELGDEGRNNSVNEAATAAALAQKLMFENKISMAELEIDESEDPIIERDVWASEKAKRVTTWKNHLLAGIAFNNFCRLVNRRSRYNGFKNATKAQVLIYGRQQDVESVLYMYQYLVKEVERLCLQEAAKNFEPKEPGRKKWSNSFRIGAADTIGMRLSQERRAQEVKAAESFTALIKREDAAVKAYVHQKHPHLRRGPSVTISDGGGYGAGQRAGRDINLRGGKGLSKAPNLLGK